MNLKTAYLLTPVFFVTLFSASLHSLFWGSVAGLFLSALIIVPVHAIASTDPNDIKQIPDKNTPIDGSTYVNQISDNHSEIIENTREELKKISGVMEIQYDYGDEIIYVLVDQNINGWVIEDIEDQFPGLYINSKLRLEIVDC